MQTDLRGSPCPRCLQVIPRIPNFGCCECVGRDDVMAQRLRAQVHLLRDALSELVDNGYPLRYGCTCTADEWSNEPHRPGCMNGQPAYRGRDAEKWNAARAALGASDAG